MEKGERTGRRIRLDEALLLVVALAIGATLVRPCMRDMKFVLGFPDHVFRAGVQQARYWGSLVYPWITPATFLLPILSIRRAWPDARSALRVPGTIACVAAGSALLIQGSVTGHLAGGSRYLFFPSIQPWIDVAQPAGYAVTGVWVSLWMGGVRTRAIDGLDGIGRILGAIWCSGAIVWAFTDLALQL